MNTNKAIMLGWLGWGLSHCLGASTRIAHHRRSLAWNSTFTGFSLSQAMKRKQPVPKVSSPPGSEGFGVRVLEGSEFEDVKAKPKRTRARKESVYGGGENGDEAKMGAEGRVIEKLPAVNSDYVPIPWKGRLGFACSNTYLRTSNPPIFCSRTCRINTILKHGQSHVKSLALANAWDLCKLIKWNEKYGIKFLRISSGMFPFASHAQHGYSPGFARAPLAEAGRLAMEYGHRLTMHPGQYTQLGSWRREVVEASVRDLEYHSELLGLLGLQGQADRDAVMVLHMGGVYKGKKETLERFRKNYGALSDDVKARLVLENDDVAWTVHDLLPICQELNIPLVLDYHHHNLRHSRAVREGTLDLLPLLPAIKQTWTLKNIMQKQHYSEPRDDATTDADKRVHSARVASLPPCDDTMDLMIEAKDKEQAVFELYKKYGIGEGLVREVVLHERQDECKPRVVRKKGEVVLAEEVVVDDEEVGMGGPERRVYWPEGMKEWLSPKKRVRRKKDIQAEAGNEESCVAASANAEPLPQEDKPKRGRGRKKKDIQAEAGDEGSVVTAGADAEPLSQKDKPKRGRGRKKKDMQAGAGDEGSVVTAGADAEPLSQEGKPKRGRGRKKKDIQAEAGDEGSVVTAGADAEPLSQEAKPRKRGRKTATLNNQEVPLTENLTTIVATQTHLDVSKTVLQGD